MRAAVRDAIRERDRFRCAYCGSAEDEIGARLTIDHYRPRSRGGDDTPNNLLACCHACNEFKGDYWSENPERLPLHPTQDDAAAYLVEQIDHLLIGLTERGRVHINLLHLNRPELIAARRRRYRAALAAELHEILVKRLDAVEAEMQQLADEIRRLTGGISVSMDG